MADSAAAKLWGGSGIASRLWSPLALLADGWARDVAIEINGDGLISCIRPNAEPAGQRVGILLPAPANAHSHSFQRAMAGLFESRGTRSGDSFWTWRKLMYRFLDQLDPGQMRAIAALAQMEMLESGYASCAEFHYVHHQPGGKPYRRLSEMAEKIVAAADQTGIGLTLLPVQYHRGGCDGRKLDYGQARFGNSLERFSLLVEECRDTINALPEDSLLGIAPHSLRAVDTKDIIEALELAGDGPIHMHLAERDSEVREVEEAYGCRPVELALEKLPVGKDWCLVHCTQMLARETIGLAANGAVAGLCPVTESNLGDGIFDGVNWFRSGGRMAVGTDSNIRISLCEELRTLEYSQRLRDRTRAALATLEHSSSGRSSFEAACLGGAMALKRPSGKIEPGRLADLMTLDDSHINLIGRSGDRCLDGWIFAGSDEMVMDVWSAGRHVVKNGVHVRRETIRNDYIKAVKSLGDAL